MHLYPCCVNLCIMQGQTLSAAVQLTLWQQLKKDLFPVTTQQSASTLHFQVQSENCSTLSAGVNRVQGLSARRS